MTLIYHRVECGRCGGSGRIAIGDMPACPGCCGQGYAFLPIDNPLDVEVERWKETANHGLTANIKLRGRLDEARAKNARLRSLLQQAEAEIADIVARQFPGPALERLNNLRTAIDAALNGEPCKHGTIAVILDEDDKKLLGRTGQVWELHLRDETGTGYHGSRVAIPVCTSCGIRASEVKA